MEFYKRLCRKRVIVDGILQETLTDGVLVSGYWRIRYWRDRQHPGRNL